MTNRFGGSNPDRTSRLDSLNLPQVIAQSLVHSFETTTARGVTLHTRIYVKNKNKIKTEIMLHARGRYWYFKTFFFNHKTAVAARVLLCMLYCYILKASFTSLL